MRFRKACRLSQPCLSKRRSRKVEVAKWIAVMIATAWGRALSVSSARRALHASTDLPPAHQESNHASQTAVPSPDMIGKVAIMTTTHCFLPATSSPMNGLLQSCRCQRNSPPRPHRPRPSPRHGLMAVSSEGPCRYRAANDDCRRRPAMPYDRRHEATVRPRGGSVGAADVRSVGSSPRQYTHPTGDHQNQRYVRWPIRSRHPGELEIPTHLAPCWFFRQRRWHRHASSSFIDPQAGSLDSLLGNACTNSTDHS